MGEINFLSKEFRGQVAFSAREIHGKLGVKSRFNDWITNQIESLGFLEGEEFYLLIGKTTEVGGRPPKEYFLTSDAAKHVALASRTEKGRAVRQWFIDFEKRSRSGIPQNYAEALQLAADQARRLQEAEVAVAFVEEYVAADGLFGLRETAKILGVGQNDFINRLISNGIIFRQSGSGGLMPYAGIEKAGYMTMKTGEANGHAFSQARFTAKGVHWVCQRLRLHAHFGAEYKPELPMLPLVGAGD